MMTARYTVKIAGAGEGGSNLTLDTDNKHDALADAESWHNDGYLVTVHDNRTGKKIYISAIVEGLRDKGYSEAFITKAMIFMNDQPSGFIDNIANPIRFITDNEYLINHR